MARTANIPANETKRQRFVRLVNPRVNRAYVAIGLIGKLGTSAHERTEDDAKAIREILHREVDIACDKLVPSKAGEKKAGGLGQIIK